MESTIPAKCMKLLAKNKGREGRASFCGQKEAKKLFYAGPEAMSPTTPMPQHERSFCAAFFKKRPLSVGLDRAWNRASLGRLSGVAHAAPEFRSSPGPLRLLALRGGDQTGQDRGFGARARDAGGGDHRHVQHVRRVGIFAILHQGGGAADHRLPARLGAAGAEPGAGPGGAAGAERGGVRQSAKALVGELPAGRRCGQAANSPSDLVRACRRAVPAHRRPVRADRPAARRRPA